MTNTVIFSCFAKRIKLGEKRQGSLIVICDGFSPSELPAALRYTQVLDGESGLSVYSGYGNTVPVQLELDPGMGQSYEAVEKICNYILTLFKKGGTLLNINIINAEQILAANENPDLFPDLVVRVTGFTAYFCLLTPEFRKLVVDRILVA